MADTESKKMIGNLWASDANADRFDPEDVGLVRNKGWPVAYEQIGSGFEPEREVFNQLLLELQSYFADKTRSGILRWDIDIDYVHSDEASSFVVGSNGKIYVANAPSGPATGNATNPVTAGQTVWRLY